ncbi:MAG: Fpg/Nei family DNA glycosylase [Vicinamibacterales bacterium]
MPEGDTIFRAARTLHRALANETVTRFETGYAHLSRIDDDAPIAGRVIEDVRSQGKHLLMRFSGALILRTHMRMNGSWHIYRPGEKWRLSTRDMRIRVETTNWVAVAFNVPDAEFVDAANLARHRPMARLGPDLLSADFDEEAALARMSAHAAEPIAEVLLNQHVVSGIGNVFKSEVLFVVRVHPDTLVATLDEHARREIVQAGRRLLQANVAPGARQGIVTYAGLRRTTGSANPGDGLWVYGRGGRPCRRCGTKIAWRKTGLDARSTYWCPTCQT